MKLCIQTGIALLLMSFTVQAGQPANYQDSANTADKRIAIHLNAAERNHLLTEMRGFLESAQQIIEGISEQDLSTVAGNARKSGMKAGAGMPAGMGKKLPAEFKQLGPDTHRRFDQLALDVDDLGDEQHTLKQLSELMKNCVACHRAYRIVASDN